MVHVASGDLEMVARREDVVGSGDRDAIVRACRERSRVTNNGQTMSMYVMSKVDRFRRSQTRRVARLVDVLIASYGTKLDMCHGVP
jgi:hypothetical protein